MFACSSRGALIPTSKHLTADTFSRASLARNSIPSIKLIHQSQRLLAPALHARPVQSKREKNGATQTSPVPRPRTRSALWAFTPDNTFQSTHHKSDITRYNLQLARCADYGNAANAFNLVRQMKNEGIKPNLSTHNHILDVCGREGMALEAWAVFDDMSLVGCKPSRQSFHYLINAHRYLDSQHMWSVLDKMVEMGVSPDASTYTHIISRFVAAENIEMTLQYLTDMTGRGLIPELPMMQAVIRLTARLGYPRLALDLVRYFEDNTVRRLDPEMWMNCLIASAEALYADGVTHCWAMTVNEFNMLPDDGLCLGVLHTAARHGLSELATDAIRTLKKNGATLAEHHFAALIEACCRADKMRDGLITLGIMRSSGIVPTSITADPIRVAISRDIDAVDKAFALVDEIHQEGRVVDVTALNAIVQAAVSLGDLQRAVGTYKAFADYKATPTADTFNSLLSGCVFASHRSLGDRLLAEMKELKIRPDMQTYEQFILLCLTQTSYEDAFFYLEEMKAANHQPSLEVYEHLVDKCFSSNDIRYKMAIEEMKSSGYQLSSRLQRKLEPLDQS